MFPFYPCSTIGISGCSNSGKTSWVFKLLKQSKSMFVNDLPEHILYCYNIFQPLYLEMKEKIANIEFHCGLPGEEKIRKLAENNKHNIIVLDDLMVKVASNMDMENLFTQKAHHMKFTVIFITQNLFTKGVCSRTISLNIHYFVLMRNPRGLEQIKILGKQIADAKCMTEAYKDATQKHYSYLVIDLSPKSDQTYRYRTNVFKDEETVVYINTSKCGNISTQV